MTEKQGCPLGQRKDPRDGKCKREYLFFMKIGGYTLENIGSLPGNSKKDAINLFKKIIYNKAELDYGTLIKTGFSDMITHDAYAIGRRPVVSIPSGPWQIAKIWEKSVLDPHSEEGFISCP